MLCWIPSDGVLNQEHWFCCRIAAQPVDMCNCLRHRTWSCRKYTLAPIVTVKTKRVMMMPVMVELATLPLFLRFSELCLLAVLLQWFADKTVCDIF